MKKKKWLIGLSAVGILGGTGFYVVPMIEESQVANSKEIEMDKFEDMTEVSFEILDTSAFNDKNLEKWFAENQAKTGEFVYYDNSHTYILVSGGNDVDDNQLISLDGVRSMSEKLVIGYEFMNGEEFGVTAKDGNIPTLLLRVEGEFESAKGIVVIKEEVKPVESQVTDKVVEGEKAESKEASADEDEKAVEKEAEVDVEEVVEKAKEEEKIAGASGDKKE